MQDLHAIITPSLLHRLYRARVPWPLTHHVSGKELIAEFFSADSSFTDAAQEAWPALKALSKQYGPDKVPDMTAFLPPPADPKFPEQAFGMHALLDQAPRVLFRGIDARWTSWFDRAARTLYTYFYGLPRQLRPWTRGRWDARDATFEYWICVASEFNASMAHRETVGDQELSAIRTEELRRAVVCHYRRRDPGRPARDGSLPPPLDEYSLVDLVTHIDLDRDWPFHEAAFFSFRVDDAHTPIISKFGRYPYRNAIEGRDSTPDELEWIRNTDHFAEAEPDVARRVRCDIEAGTWTPLGEGKGKERAEPAPVGRISSDVSLSVAIRTEA
ncbi:hypothetical protein DHEL01_v206406 [Diaporthe helianthi]|uniref:Uncharacterized protein n=1 Tax=Diaporthe helianthi TaxID=158607 RepID=A0A2P5HY75_DIAHE|nr:hypothetical protein DHEL01_v206406 [Diaporthe helianthi]